MHGHSHLLRMVCMYHLLSYRLHSLENDDFVRWMSRFFDRRHLVFLEKKFRFFQRLFVFSKDVSIFSWEFFLERSFDDSGVFLESLFFFKDYWIFEHSSFYSTYFSCNVDYYIQMNLIFILYHLFKQIHNSFVEVFIMAVVCSHALYAIHWRKYQIWESGKLLVFVPAERSHLKKKRCRFIYLWRVDREEKVTVCFSLGIFFWDIHGMQPTDAGAGARNSPAEFCSTTSRLSWISSYTVLWAFCFCSGSVIII